MFAVVPAHNEAPTVAAVVSTLLAARAFEGVLVVNDGSTDETAARAAAAGARVLDIYPNGGKGEAMLRAVSALPVRDAVAFFDADLQGLRPDHVQQMIAARARGFDQVCGIRDYSNVRNTLQKLTALAHYKIPGVITGERIVARWILERLPATCWQGYSIETALNYVCAQGGGRTAIILLDGLTIRTKLDKQGTLKGLAGQVKMFSEIADTHRALGESGGAACKT